jgi:hypothetical protein
MGGSPCQRPIPDVECRTSSLTRQARHVGGCRAFLDRWRNPAIIRRDFINENWNQNFAAEDGL